MTNVKALPVVNYSADVLTLITSDYTTAKAAGVTNATILADLSAKYSKTIPSLRAKLASLKIYVTDAPTPEKATLAKAKKADYVLNLSALVGRQMDSLESATKSDLIVLIGFIKRQQDKIDQLATDLMDAQDAQD